MCLITAIAPGHNKPISKPPSEYARQEKDLAPLLVGLRVHRKREKKIMRRSICIPALCVALLVLWAPANSVLAAIYWIGRNTVACDAEANAHDFLSLAIVAAALTAENDEIRMTDTVSYVGSLGKSTFTDFMPGVRGSLIVSGGYADCGSSQTGRAIVDGTTGDSFTVNTSNRRWI